LTGELTFDINDVRIAELRSGKDSTLEADSKELLAATQLEFSSSHSKLEECNVFIITVPTPIDTANLPNLTPIINASETVGKAMEAGAIQLEKKLEIMSIFASELEPSPFPRSEVALYALALLRGSQSGVHAAEAFMLLKDIQ